MALILKGTKGDVTFASAATDTGTPLTRFVQIDQGQALFFYEKIAIAKPAPSANHLGLFTMKSVGNKEKIKIGSLGVPKHLWTKRKNGCEFVPKGGIKTGVQEFTMNALEFDGVECPDALYGDSLETIYGVGLEVENFFATKAGQDVFNMILNRIFLGLGNSMYDLVWNGASPWITEAANNNWYEVEEDEWVDYVDQMEAMGGIITQIDQLKAMGLPHFRIEIKDSEVEGENYKGEVGTVLFPRVKKGATKKMIIATKRKLNGRSFYLVTPSIYNKYKEEIIETYNNIPIAYQVFTTGTTGDKILLEDCLMWDGIYVVCMDEWDEFGVMCNIIQHRVFFTVPGNIALLYDIPMLNESTGFGLEMVQKLDPEYKGKIFLHTTLKLGTGLIDHEFCANASYTLTP